MPNPPDQVAYVNSGTTGNIDLGNNFSAISFNNNAPFSFEAWMRFRTAPAATGIILQKQSEFVLSYTPSGNIGVWRAGQSATLLSSSTVAANVWAHIGVTYDGTTLTLYIDGIQDSFIVVTNAGVPNQGSDFIAGTGGNSDIDTIRMWSICQTSGYMYQAPWAPEPAAGTTGLVANYDLSLTPPADISGNNHSITLNAPATSILSAAAVLLQGSSFVDPAEQDLIPCGDTPYTIDAWIYLTSTTGLQAIFTSGNLNDAGTMALTVNNGVFQSQRGSTVLAASGSIPLSTWTHVATTYDGTTLTVYVNGSAAGSLASGGIPSVIGQPVLVGAFNLDALGGQSNYLQGDIQYISVWTIALTAAQVQQLMYDDPTLQPGCIANFSFSQTLPVDLNTGEPLTLLGGAVLGEQMTPWSPSQGAAARERRQIDISPAQRERAIRRRLRRARATVRRIAETVPRGTPPSLDETADALLAELASFIGVDVPAAERARILDEQRRRLDDLKSGGAPPIGTVTHEIVDDHHVLTFHGPNGPEVIFRAHVDDVDACTVWWIQFIFTLLSGFASLLGLTAPVTAKLTEFVTTLVEDLAFMAAVAPLFTGAVTAQTVISFLVLLYNNGYLWTFFKFCFTQMGWWAIGRLVLYVVGLFVPAPSPAKVEFAVNAARLVVSLIGLLPPPC